MLRKNANNSFPCFLGAMDLLDEIKYNYIQKNVGKLNNNEMDEIKIWCNQRKMAIAFNSIVNGNNIFRIKIILWFFHHMSLLLSKNGMKYIKNRITRILNENHRKHEK